MTFSNRETKGQRTFSMQANQSKKIKQLLNNNRFCRMVIEVWIEIEVRKFRPVQCPVPCTKKLEARTVAKTTGGTRCTGPAQSACSRNKSVGRFAIAQTSWLILLLFREQPDKSPGNLRLFTTNWTIRKHESVCAGAKGGVVSSLNWVLIYFFVPQQVQKSWLILDSRTWPWFRTWIWTWIKLVVELQFLFSFSSHSAQAIIVQ